MLETNVEFVFKLMRKAFAAFLAAGIISLVLAIFIIYYPYLLAVIVAANLIMIGLIFLLVASYFWTYSKLTIKV